MTYLRVLKQGKYCFVYLRDAYEGCGNHWRRLLLSMLITDPDCHSALRGSFLPRDEALRAVQLNSVDSVIRRYW